MNIVITGASSGIGYELVKQFAQKEENNILALARSPRQLTSLLKNKTNIRFMPVDFERITESLFDFILANWKKDYKTDILINNAGTLLNKPLISNSLEDFDRLMNVNVKSAYFLVQHLLGSFSNPAHIINIGSMAGVQGSRKYSGLSLYSASKGALSTLTESMAEELAPMGISVNMLALGAVDTQMFNEAFPGLKTRVGAEEIAKFASRFAVEGMSLFNGKIIPVSFSNP